MDITQYLDRDSLTESTLDLIEAGFHIIQLHPITSEGDCSCYNNKQCHNAGKHPKTPDWRNAKPLTEDVIENLQDHATGYGIVLSSELLVVDVDAANGKKGLESKKKLEEHLGDTLENLSNFIVESGSGSGSTHYYFRKDSDVKVRKKLSKDYPDIDFLSDGCYVVAPNSLHKSGGTYTFFSNKKREPSKITDAIAPLISLIERKDEFIDHIDHQAGSCTLDDIRSMLSAIDPNIDYEEWIKVCFGVHHETSGSQSGYEIFDQWCQGYLNDQYTVIKYKGSGDTFSKWREGDKPSANKIKIGTVIQIAYDYGWGGSKPDVEIDFEGFFKSIGKEIEKEVIQTEDGIVYEHEELPKELQHLQGALGSFVQWGLDVAPKPSYIIELIGALQAMSTVIGRDFKTEKNDYSNNYFMVVGGSACGKDMVYTMSSAITSLIASKYPNEAKTLANKPTSTGGLYTQLEICPRTHAIHDEMSGWIKKVISGTTGGDADIAFMFMSLWGRASKDLIRDTYSQQTRKKEDRDDSVLLIKNPWVSLTGLTTPAALGDCLNGLLMQNGFMNRFLMAIPVEHNRKVRDFQTKPLPISVMQWVDSIHTRLANHNGNSYAGLGRDKYDQPINPVVLKFTEKAFDLLHNKFQDEILEMMDECEQKGYSDTMSRAYEQAKRISLTLQLAINPFAEYIDIEAAEMACAMVKYLKRLELNFYDMYYSETKFEAMSKKVVEIIQDSGSKGVLQATLSKRKPMSSLDVNNRKNLLNALMDSETIGFINENEGKKGAPKRRFYLSKYIKEKED